MALAKASQHEYPINYLPQNDSLDLADMMQASTEDRAQFPAPNSSFPPFDSYAFPPTFTNDMYNSPQSTNDIQASPADMITQTPTPYNYSQSSNSESNGSQAMTAFPSQLCSQQFEELPPLTHDSSEGQTPEESEEPHQALDFKVDITEHHESEEMSGISPPAPSTPFKSPAPMDIASRRKKVHVKPAALVPESRNRPSLGPRTVSNVDGFRRGIESPLASPMRRIASAGGNVISGRIFKAGMESAQPSPINLGGFTDVGAFMEAGYHSIRHPPSLSALSSLNSSLAPPTPLSPRERGMTLGKREGSQSTASPHEGSMNSYVFNPNVPGCLSTTENDQNMASPPETPQAQLALQGNSGWPVAVDFQDRQWAFEVPDEPLYTPAHENFNLELQMPQPSYLNNISQPVTPGLWTLQPRPHPR